MHKITIRTFEKVEDAPEVQKELLVRNQTEDLIAQIVQATSEKNKKKLAKQLALAVNTLKWTTTDLHVLLNKRNDPSIRNYTAFVWWSSKIKNK